MNECGFEGCDRTDVIKKTGYCNGHHLQWYRGYELKPLRVRGSNRTCSVEGCDNKHSAKGYCGMHYQRAKHGDPTDTPAINKLYGPDSLCKIEGCTEKPVSKWMCSKHYWRIKNYGYIKQEDDVELKEDERRCDWCRKVKHWTKFARKEQSGGVQKYECLDCYRNRILPPNKERKKQTLEDFLKTLPNGNNV